MNKLKINLQFACNKNFNIPNKKMIYYWLSIKIIPFKSRKEITIRFVNESEIYQLNMIYRGKKSSTNVLAFPYEPISYIKNKILGDIIICASIIKTEADQQKKSIYAHFAHMIIHGTLHLLGYNHINKKESKKMEQMEIKILSILGYSNPFIL